MSMIDRDPSDADGQAPVGDASVSRRGSLLAAGSVLAVVLLGVWSVAASVAALGAYRDLDAARSEFLLASRELRDADLGGARVALAEGVAGASSAADSLTAWYVVPIRALPVAGPNLRAATSLSVAARDGGGAALELLDAAAIIVHDERDQPRGTISLDYIAELAPPLRQLADTLQTTTAEVEAIDPGQLHGRVEAARQQYLDLVGPYVDDAAIAADLVEVIPTFLGADSPRTYLVAAASLSELRSSGGLLGSWATMTADAGAMAFGEFQDIDALEGIAVDAPSEEFASRYEHLGALRLWRNLNVTPDFPSAATTMVAMWEANGRPALDGVIVVDPVAFHRLVDRSGAVDVPGITTLTPETTLPFVGVEAYAAFEDQDERKLVLGATAASLFEEVFDVIESDDVPATALMFAAMAADGHLRLFSRDTAVQEVFVRGGLAGELPPSTGESVGVFANNVAANKVDYFVERRIDHEVDLLADGVARSTVTTTFTNTAPREGYPRHVLGPWADGLEAGDVRYLLQFTCSATCVIHEVPDDASNRGSEAGRPVRDLWVDIPSQASRSVRFVTTSGRAWEQVDGAIVLDLEHLTQPTLFGIALTVRVAVPPEMTAVEIPEGATVEDEVVVWSDPAASGVRHVRFGFGPLTSP
jgi:hypothetical protein